MSETWLVGQWLEGFTQVLEAMVDEHPSLTWTTEGSGELGPNPLLIEQAFASSPDPMVWIGVPEATWRDLGSRVLQSAGVEKASDEESRNTCLEILQQSIGGLAQALTARLEREIATSVSRQPPFFPEGLPIVQVSLQYGDSRLPPLWIAFAPLLKTWLEKMQTPMRNEEEQTPAAHISKTFDLLLDVALPVSVSFGRTELAVKEVLKLTTGSIVELNRAVSEPVEVIVNNCVIAHGEVVVVEGNYGVRINRIVSRQERLRTGSSAGAALHVPRSGSTATSQSTL